MADSTWTDAPQHTVEGWRNNWDNGQPPEPGYRPSDDSTKTTPPDADGWTTKWRITTYTNVTCAPPPVEIFETCDKCAGHNHSVKNAATKGAVNIPPASEEHCAPAHYGDHYGQVFTNSTCTGFEIRRTETTLIAPDGTPMPSFDQWDQRVINHVTNGVFWYGAITNFPCFSGSGQEALTTFREVERIVAVSVSQAGLVENPERLQIALTDFLPLLRTATLLGQPQIAIEGAGADRTMLLLDGAGPGVPYGRLAMQVSANGRHLRATHWTRDRG